MDKENNRYTIKSIKGALPATGRKDREGRKMNYKIPVLIILTVIYLFKMLKNLARSRSAGRAVPANVADVYDPETYGKWKAYHAEKNRLNYIKDTADYAIGMILMAFDLYAAFAKLFPPDLFMQMMAVVLLSELASLLTLPAAWYDTMVIEEKYGFNRSRAGTFWADQVKELIIGLCITIGIGAMLMGVHQSMGDWMIPVFAAVMTVFMLAFSFLYPFFSKIFNKFTPLEEGELKEKLTALLEKHGYQVRAIQVMDASKRSTKSNAYFSGFGKTKTIVLYDTLVQAMTPDEICAVFAHEMGHGLHKDVLKRQVLSFGQMLVLGILAWLTLRTAGIFTDFGFTEINYGFALILIMEVEFALISPLFGLVMNAISRRNEYRADAQAVEEGYGEELISGLKKLAKGNFADLSPDPWLVKLDYSHPTLSQRIDAIRKKS